VRITSYAASKILPLQIVATLIRSYTGESEFSESATDSLANQNRSVWIAVVRRSPRSVGHIHGQKSVIDCIISGPTHIALRDTDKAQVSHCISECETNSLLRKFWKDEEILQKLFLKEEDEQCEKHFSIHSHISEGRYTVQLSFKTGSPIDIGESLPITAALYARMENRLQSRPEISKQYYDFLEEYLEVGNMESVTESKTTLFKPVYIPLSISCRCSRFKQYYKITRRF